MVSTNSIMARAALFITENTWNTNWDLYLSIFDIAEIGKDTKRLYRSQSWGDDDYPDRVRQLLMSIVEYNEDLAFRFLKYIIKKEFDLTDPEIIKKDKELLKSLNLIGEDSGDEIITEPFDISPEKYLDIKVLPNDFYIELQNQINKAFAYNVLPAVQILSRKFFENLIIDILRKKYKGAGIDLYYNTGRRRFQGFEILLKNLSDKLDEGDFDGVSSAFDKDLLRRVNNFREQGNSSAHSIELDLRREDIRDKKDELGFLIKVLLKVLESC